MLLVSVACSVSVAAEPNVPIVGGAILIASPFVASVAVPVPDVSFTFGLFILMLIMLLTTFKHVLLLQLLLLSLLFFFCVCCDLGLCI